ncbi:MAG TPA: type II CAAX endopeptidase family protein [Planctomycetota bacterium]
MNDDPALPPRVWPRGRASAEDALAATCTTCGAAWRVDRSLAGFRLRCDCGAWVSVEALPAQLPAPSEAPVPLLPADLEAQPRVQGGLIPLPGEPGEVVFTPIPVHLPMAPGTVQRASPSTQARWTNRTLLEFAALLVALLGPQVLALLFATGSEVDLLLPFSAIGSGVLVALVVACSGPYGRIGLCAAPRRFFLEAVLAAGAGCLLAAGWLAVLRTLVDGLDTDVLTALEQRLGVPVTLFVIAVAPAVLEEVMFRGMLQGRLLALMGMRAGLLTTAAAFAVCHGGTAALPIHFGLGLYLGWLRERSGSLLPGMLAHFSYNALIVLFGI